ncbi:MAG TPA: ABC transporter substrate-binding protein [Candidatus Binatia bacterium]|nr:ABC transporter substrate-binding protein [Candidatus Binatia bacterium]
MTRSLLVFICLLPAVFLPAGSLAQQPTKLPRIGYLSGASSSTNVPRREVFRQGLRELGYVEGKNIVIEYRYGEGKFDLLSVLAAELVRLKVEIILTAGPGPTRAAKAATSTIPIVMAQDSDPVADGFVASLARPGGNITGLSTFAPELGGKRLEILREVVPKLVSVGVLGNSNFPGNAPAMREMELAAKVFKVQLQYLDVRGPEDIGTAFRVASKGRADAVLTLTSAILSTQRAQIIELAVKNRLPAMYHNSQFVEAGGLMAYSANLTDLFHRSATYVDKILKGTKPADLPVQQPTKFEFIINLKAAKQIDLTIPPNVLARADKVIK